MKSKIVHTSGPWHIGMKPGPMIYGQRGEQIADCRGLNEAGYNARLIVLAPELLEALKAIERELRQEDNQYMIENIQNIIGVTLPKAEGK